MNAEASPDLLIASMHEQFGKAFAWRETMRLKWLMHREFSIQMDADELIVRAVQVKNETL